MTEILPTYFNEVFDFTTDEAELSRVIKMPSDITAYHNTAHARNVSSLGFLFSSNSFEVAIAGLFHDADHTRSGTTPDYRNIERALNVWYGFHDAHRDDFFSLPATSENLRHEVAELIISTNSAATPNATYDHNALALYDADTLAGVLVEAEIGEQAYINTLHNEGYANAGNAVGFAKFRGLYTDEAKRWFHEQTGVVID